MTSIRFVVDDDDVIRMLTRTEGALDKLLNEAAEELADTMGEEARGVSSRLATGWKVEGFGKQSRKVVAPEFFAHFLAGGTQAHGPRSASRLVFVQDGQAIFARHVSGVRADHYDTRAVRKTEGELDNILKRVLREAGV